MDAPPPRERAAPRTYSAAEVDAAVERLADPARFSHATDVVTHAAPSLAGVLDGALAAGGWFDNAHDELIRQAVEEPDLLDRARAIRSLIDEQTRLGMLVGVAIGFELREELTHAADLPINRQEG